MIIKASPEHAEALSELGADTFYNSHKHSAPENELAAYMKKIYSVEAIRNELTNPINIYHMIKHNDHLIGFSKIELNIKHPAIEKETVSKMDQIYLLHSFHGQKLGAKLLNYNIDYSKSYGQNGMWLVVWSGNTIAISFYRKFGFQVVTRDQFLLTDTHLNPCYIMFLDYNNTKIKATHNLSPEGEFPVSLT